jgi:adenylate kinase family enzyme
MTTVIGVTGRMGTGKTSVCKTLAEWNPLRKWKFAWVSSGDIARMLPQTEASIKITKETGLDPREQLIRAGVLEAIEDHDASGHQVVLLDGFPRTADQLTMLDSNRRLQRLLMIHNAHSLSFVKARGRYDFEHEVATDRAQEVLLTDMVARGIETHMKASSESRAPRFMEIDTTGWKLLAVAKWVDSVARFSYFEHHGLSQPEWCSICFGSGVQAILQSTETCRLCEGSGEK